MIHIQIEANSNIIANHTSVHVSFPDSFFSLSHSLFHVVTTCSVRTTNMSAYTFMQEEINFETTLLTLGANYT